MQIIITYLIIASSVAYALYTGIHSLCKKKEKNTSPCVGCSSCPAKKEVIFLIEKRDRKKA